MQKVYVIYSLKKTGLYFMFGALSTLVALPAPSLIFGFPGLLGTSITLGIRDSFIQNVDPTRSVFGHKTKKLMLILMVIAIPLQFIYFFSDIHSILHVLPHGLFGIY